MCGIPVEEAIALMEGERMRDGNQKPISLSQLSEIYKRQEKDRARGVRRASSSK